MRVPGIRAQMPRFVAKSRLTLKFEQSMNYVRYRFDVLMCWCNLYEILNEISEFCRANQHLPAPAEQGCV